MVAENVEALNALDEDAKPEDKLLVYLVKRRLDPETKYEWDRQVKDKKDDSFESLTSFLYSTAHMLESASATSADH